MLMTNINASLALDGGSVSSVTTPALTQLNTWTVGFWAKTRDNQGGVVANDIGGFNNDFIMGVAEDLGQTDYFWGLTVQRASDSTRQQIRDTKPITGEWQHVVGTYDGTTLSLYVDGALVATLAAANCFIKAAAYRLGGSTLASRYFLGNISQFFICNTALSASSVLSIYLTGKMPSTILYYKLDEGAGSVVYDSSGNGNHGTTNAIFTSDSPFKLRTVVDGNIVKNGNFEIYPPFVAATNTQGRYIDGTAGGAAVGSVISFIFGAWGIAAAAVSNAETKFDTSIFHSGTASLLLSSTATASSSIVVVNGTSGSNLSLADLYPVQPNTTYTMTAWMKTTTIGTNGAYIDVREYSGAGTAVTTTSTAKLSGTNDWTKVQLTLTTTGSTQYLQLLLRASVQAAGSNYSVWFDDIEIRPTYT